MPDEIDLAQEREHIATHPAAIESGTPGDCDLCGEWSGRLIDGVCAPCHNRYKPIGLK
jgi:hypothetical protein